MLAYAFITFVWLVVNQRQLDVLIFGVTPGKLPDSQRLPLLDKLDREQHKAWRRLAWTALLALYFVGCAHRYDAEHDRLVSVRHAARMQQPPFHCAGRDDWETAGWIERATYVMRPASLEEACAEWDRRTHLDVRPNPFWICYEFALDIFLRPIVRFCDAMGEATDAFLHHFGLLLQSYFLVILPFALVALVLFSAPFRACLSVLRAWMWAVGGSVRELCTLQPPVKQCLD